MRATPRECADAPAKRGSKRWRQSITVPQNAECGLTGASFEVVPQFSQPGRSSLGRGFAPQLSQMIHDAMAGSGMGQTQGTDHREGLAAAVANHADAINAQQ